MSIEHSETINRANRCGNPPQILNMLLIRNPLFEDSLALPLELPKQVQYKLIQILDRKLGIFAKSCSLMLHNILSIHIQLMYLSSAKVISKS